MPEKVSIIVPVYNVQKYLKECLKSLTNQSYNNLEIILVDDGSTDNSGKISDEYAKKDSRIIIIHQKNFGAANAKNKGLDICSGELVTFMDSDDIVELNWIEIMVNTLHKYKADMVECSMDKLYIDKYEIVENQYKNNQSFTSEEYLSQYFSVWTNSLFYLKLFKHSLTNQIRFRTERRCIDDEFYTYKVISKAKKIVHINNVLYHYRQRKSSVVQTEKNLLQITNDAIDLRIERFEWIKRHFPKLKNIFLFNDINFLLYFYENAYFDKSAAEKYKKTAWYYFINSVKSFAKIKIIYLSFIMLTVNPKIDYNSVSLRNDDKLNLFP